MIKHLVENIKIKLDSSNGKILKNNSVLKCYNLIKNYNDNDWIKFKSEFHENSSPNYCKHVIFRNEDFELILIKWDKGSSSSNHLHPNNGCILKVLEGSLVEERFFEKTKYKITKLSKNNMGFMHNILGSHKIISEETTYSIHLYSPPNFYN